jgi:hypothetical protein
VPPAGAGIRSITAADDLRIATRIWASFFLCPAVSQSN